MGVIGDAHALVCRSDVQPHARVSNQIPTDEVCVAAVGGIAERALYGVRPYQCKERSVFEGP